LSVAEVRSKAILAAFSAKVCIRNISLHLSRSLLAKCSHSLGR